MCLVKPTADCPFFALTDKARHGIRHAGSNSHLRVSLRRCITLITFGVFKSQRRYLLSYPALHISRARSPKICKCSGVWLSPAALHLILTDAKHCQILNGNRYTSILGRPQLSCPVSELLDFQVRNMRRATLHQTKGPSGPANQVPPKKPTPPWDEDSSSPLLFSLRDWTIMKSANLLFKPSVPSGHTAPLFRFPPFCNPSCQCLPTRTHD